MGEREVLQRQVQVAVEQLSQKLRECLEKHLGQEQAELNQPARVQKELERVSLFSGKSPR